MLPNVEADLKKSIDAQLVDELVAAYEQAKRNFYLGGLRLSAVEGGRFCEAAFRILQHVTTGMFASLNQQIDSEKTIQKLREVPKDKQPDSIRLHIPRALRVVYDIRNNRDTAHLADGIDPNMQDATLVISILDWVMAELVRLYHQVSAAEAQRIIEDIIVRRAPAVENFDGFLKVLRPSLLAGDYVLLLLYERGKLGASLNDLKKWVRPAMRANIRRTLDRLVDESAYVHEDNDKFMITALGMADVEKRKLHEIK